MGEARTLMRRRADAAAYREAIGLSSTDAQAIAAVDEAECPAAGLTAGAKSARLRGQLERAGPAKSAAGIYGELAREAEAAGRAGEADALLRRGRAFDPANGQFLDREFAILFGRGLDAEVVAAADRFVEGRPDSAHSPRLLTRKAESLRADGRDRDPVRFALAAVRMCIGPA